MIIGTLKITIHVPWVRSLKEKRSLVKGLSAKVGNKFNVSIAEVAGQDAHQSIVVGLACITTDTHQANSILDKVLNFIESNTEGEIISVEREIF